MFKIFGSSTINLADGIKLSAFKIKKDYEKLLPLYNQDPQEFISLQFMAGANLAEVTKAYKDYQKNHIELFLAFDNGTIVGAIEIIKTAETIIITGMVDYNYGYSPAFRYGVNHFLKKYANKNIQLTISNYDLATLEELRAYGIESNILYISNGQSFQFAGPSIEEATAEDWQPIDESFSVTNFFASAMASGESVDQTEVVADENENYEEAYSNEEEEEETDQIDVEDSQYLDEPVAQPDSVAETIHASQDPQMPQVNPIQQPIQNQSIQQPVQTQPVQQPYNQPMQNQYGPQQPYNQAYGQQYNNYYQDPYANQNQQYSQEYMQQQMTPENTMQKPEKFAKNIFDNNDPNAFVTRNVINTLQEISKIPENENYSKTNPDLFSTISTTPTFKNFQDSNIRESRMRSQTRFNNFANDERTMAFRARLAEIREKRGLKSFSNEQKTPSYIASLKSKREKEDYMSSRSSRFSSRDDNYVPKYREQNREDSLSKPESSNNSRKGFGSRVMSI